MGLKLNRKGISLIEVMMALGMMMVGAMAVTSVITHMRTQIWESNRKIETMELRGQISRAMSDQATCTCIMNQYSQAFNVQVTDAQSVISEIRHSCTTDASVVVRANDAMPGSQTQLRIGNIRLSNIERLNTAEHYRGRIRIEFENDSSRGIALRPLELDGRFTTRASDPATAKNIEFCKFSAMTDVDLPSHEEPPPVISGICPEGQFVTGIVESQVRCSAIPLIAAQSPREPANFPFTMENPGPGCSGQGCRTEDFGACVGQGCRTNGNRCDGQGCRARGPQASCGGQGCCAGPRCT